MSAFNPFRRNLNDGPTGTPHLNGFALAKKCRETGDATTATASAPQTNKLTPSLSSTSVQPISSVLEFPRKSSLSLEIEEDDDSTSSDEQTADPFNPDSSVSDTEDDDNIQTKGSAPGDHPRHSFGSAPHSAPSTDGSSTPPSEGPLNTNEYKRSTASSTTSSTNQNIPSSLNRPESEYKQGTSPTSRTNRDKRPPPPPKSHHGKRISATANPSSSQSTSSRPNYQLSFQSASPESLATSRTAATPNASSAQPPVPDYFSIQSQSQVAAGSNDSLSRSGSQKRAPTPPLSRRQSQLRSKSTESKSSTSRLTMTSRDLESNDSSQPPSPGPSVSSALAFSRDRNRMSMPPPSSGSLGDLRTAISSAGAGQPSPTNSQTSQSGRRASSYGNIASGSSMAPPPPPPPRRARDGARSTTDGRPVSQVITAEEPSPQPSNALDILADLSRLQKEVDDLRGHYEGRKTSE
ncbi:hypothetical protein N7520_002627 [Penicillium odoratum]|uniref:uncharacterized protein n=1 Tax=Penicillium odoratum TaxID=1167516 RepID=UPI0025479058|nr:uncharacterized protein N7520_002627 [Penicillium odoratum]KAJ5772098.1 hypothetical protein N7520_002627 [Penicillium odoratum]